MKTLTKPDLLADREVRYRRRMNLRVTTKEQAIEFVNDVGFCCLFPIQGVEMPSLWQAVAGRVLKTTNKHSGYEIERTWGWKDDSLEISQAIYRLRKCTVEPVIGIIKEMLGFRQFSLRGLVAAAGEWCLVCLAFNLKRLQVLFAN